MEGMGSSSFLSKREVPFNMRLSRFQVNLGVFKVLDSCAFRCASHLYKRDGPSIRMSVAFRQNRRKSQKKGEKHCGCITYCILSNTDASICPLGLILLGKTIFQRPLSALRWSQRAFRQSVLLRRFAGFPVSFRRRSAELGQVETDGAGSWDGRGHVPLAAALSLARRLLRQVAFPLARPMPGEIHRRISSQRVGIYGASVNQGTFGRFHAR